MDLVVISDTHGKHEDLGKLSGDVLIHCGDLCDGSARGPAGLDAIDAWFGEQDFECILCVGGNHDFAAQERWNRGATVLRNAVFLVDQAHEHGGLKFYGSPWVTYLPGWAFYEEPDALKSRWTGIPDDTDVLITHTPPLEILDTTRDGTAHLGCPHLRRRVGEVAPRLHCFGHVHAGAGREERGGTTFINATMVDRGFEIGREPFRYEL